MKKIIFSIFLCCIVSQAFAKKNNVEYLAQLQNDFTKCSETFYIKSEQCSDTGSMKCYKFLTELHKSTQNCYTEVAKRIFLKFYNLDEQQANQKIEDFASSIYKNYFYIYQENNYCRANNCGISAFLYSEYATTFALKDYIDMMFTALEIYL